ncbi:S-adenosylmethionine-dependent tRNA (m5U54) methyltransferase [Fragilaria crotonensis]|nr:S-adenosylmethionine-dependent tRNA (m5U54) methyltransferase [Fragilaria crotonensis]
MTVATTVALPGYEAQLRDSGVEHSRRKLQEAATELQSVADNISWSHCELEEETIGYRSICTFQLVLEGGQYQYAMRHDKRPVFLGTSAFPIATHRIQRAMQKLLSMLNADVHSVLSNHVTSISLASSWNDTPTCDCIVTLMYQQPVHEDTWRTSAEPVRQALHLTRFIGRSRGRLVFVSGPEDRDYLEDTVYIYLSGDAPTRVTLSKEDVPAGTRCIPILYQKPESAFFHPNSRAMVKVLEWMMDRLQSIGQISSMLEMYCGCGAHTIALAKSGFVERIVAVELDNRLVQACVTNCELNGCHGDDSHNNISPVYVFRGDASEWAHKSLLKSRGWYNGDYDVLLVDPPRMGLADNVCQMAIEGSFHHILYISCGLHALKRDLARLKVSFEVVDCHLVDLFPRTDSVESVVHLKRCLP